MGILSGDYKVPRLDLELTTACDHRCAHCYNVWNTPQGAGGPGRDYPTGQLDTEGYLELMQRAVAGSGADQLTLTGGEPLLRADAAQLVQRACELVSSVSLVSNAAHLDRPMVRRLASAGLASVQLTLLAAEAAKHDRFKGAPGSFDSTVRAALDLRDEGLTAQVCFVASNETWAEFEEVLELCFALGVRSVAYNRVAPAGAAAPRAAALVPLIEQVEANLQTAEELGRRWQIQVATAMPIPPCLVRLERYPWVRFGFCSTNTSSPNLVLDPLGNVRPCNLSSTLLGNVLERDWRAIMRHRYLGKFARALPRVCRGCTHEASCRGGCKESALATFGSLSHPEPLLQDALDPDWRAGL